MVISSEAVNIGYFLIDIKAILFGASCGVETSKDFPPLPGMR